MFSYSSNKPYTNRYGVKYSFDSIGKNKYIFNMEPRGLQYCRCGGQEGQLKVDNNNLGFFDPAGGPFISHGILINKRKVINICINEQHMFELTTD